TFTAVNETYALAGIDNPRIGLAAFANSGSPGAVVNAHFDWFHITPDNTSAAGEPNDEFDGTSLDACRWTVANEDADAYRVNDGALEIDPVGVSIFVGNGPAAREKRCAV